MDFLSRFLVARSVDSITIEREGGGKYSTGNGGERGKSGKEVPGK